MSVRGRDVIFEFKDSCNCCWSTPLEDHDPVFVSPRGAVTKFDFKKAPGADANAKKTLANLEIRLTELAQNQQQIASILAQIGKEMQIDLGSDVRILRTVDVRRIEAIALPILREPSPEPHALVRSQKSRDLSAELHSEAEWEEV